MLNLGGAISSSDDFLELGPILSYAEPLVDPAADGYSPGAEQSVWRVAAFTAPARTDGLGAYYTVLDPGDGVTVRQMFDHNTPGDPQRFEIEEGLAYLQIVFYRRSGIGDLAYNVTVVDYEGKPLNVGVSTYTI